MLTRILFLILVLTLLTPPTSAQAPARSTLTLEWIFSDEGRRVASVPSSQWLADGKLMLSDGRVPASQRAFEIIDPQTSTRRTALNRLRSHVDDNRAGELHGRLLIVHGSYDDNVHPQHVLAFTDALIKAGKLFDLMIYPMRKHDIGDQEATLHLFGTMQNFWKRNL